MPSGPSRTQQKAEAKYNVTTDFPRLDLHSAAASGNLGLVKFALSHGQPINSVLESVLPMHAACAGGSVVVVNYLISQGADVNAQQLPRRYSNDKNRHNNGLIVGTSGSTPLHFAAANGHTDVVKILLVHGARAWRTDKHGITAEMLARDNGWVDCADVLREWRAEHEGEPPPERDEPPEGGGGGGAPSPGFPLGSKRLHVKRSIDNALHLLKAGHHHHHREQPPLPPSPSSATFAREPPSPAEYTFYPPPHADADAPPARRPSLPHLYDLPDSPFHRRTSGRARKRPSSAGTGAEQGTGPGPGPGPSPGQAAGLAEGAGGEGAEGAPRRLGHKYSLLSLFKNRAVDAPSGSPSPTPREDGADAQDAFAPTPLSSSPGHGPGPRYASDTPPSPTERAPDADALPDAGAGAGASVPHWFRSRFGSEVGVPSPLATSAVELHHALSRDRLRELGGVVAGAPGGSGVGEGEEGGGGGGSGGGGGGRPSILRGHSRSTSSQSASTASAGARTLRFDPLSASPGASPASASSPAKGALGPPRPGRRLGSHSPAGRLRVSNSVSSLRSKEELARVSEMIDSPGARGFRTPDSAPPQREDFEEEVVFEVAPVVKAKPSPLALGTHVRPRGQSFASSCSSLSPGLSPDGNATSAASASDFPFSLDHPPPTSASTIEQPDRLGVPKQVYITKTAENRIRGDSVSSMETDASANAQLSQSSSTSGTNVTALSTPPTHPPSSAAARTPVYGPHEHDSPTSSCEDLGLPSSPTHTLLRGGAGRMPANRAEAEALVQQTQKEILELASLADAAGPAGPGRVPLSAQLAAYGEMLALERRFAKGERQREQWANRSDGEDEGEPPAASVPRSATLAKDVPYGGISASRRRETGFGQVQGEQAVRPGPAKVGSTDVRPLRLPPKAPKLKRPHTAEGKTTPPSPLHDRAFSAPGARPDDASTPEPRPKHGQSRSTSSPLHTDSNAPEKERVADIKIIETTATPVDSTLSSDIRQHTYYSEPVLRPPLPHPRLSDPEPPLPSAAAAPTGVPLVRTSTAPLQNTFNELSIQPDPRSRHIASANKLARMGFAGADAPHGAGTPPSTSRAQAKQRFGIRSLMQSLKGKQ